MREYTFVPDAKYERLNRRQIRQMKPGIRVKFFDAMNTISEKNHAEGRPDIECGDVCCRTARLIDWFASLEEN